MEQDFNYVNKQLGENIAKLRRQSGFSQKQFANYLGMSQSIVSAWEIGDREMSLSMIWKIAHFFRVPVTTLLPIAYSGMADDEARSVAEKMNTDVKWRNAFEKMDFLSQKQRDAVFSVIDAMYEGKAND